MKKTIALICLAVSLILLSYCSREKPWVGTYMLMVNDKNREVFNTLKEHDTPWPHVNIMEDGTFTLIRPYNSGSGVYRVEGTAIVMTLTEYDGSLPIGNLAQSKKIESRNNFQYIMFEGPQGDPWIKLSPE